MSRTNQFLDKDGSVNAAKAAAAAHRARRQTVTAGFRWICEALSLAPRCERSNTETTAIASLKSMAYEIWTKIASVSDRVHAKSAGAGRE